MAIRPHESFFFGGGTRASCTLGHFQNYQIDYGHIKFEMAIFKFNAKWAVRLISAFTNQMHLISAKLAEFETTWYKYRDRLSGNGMNDWD